MGEMTHEELSAMTNQELLVYERKHHGDPYMTLVKASSARHRVIEPGDVTGADLLRTRLAQGSQRGGDALQLRPFSLVGGEVGADGVLVGRVDRRLGLWVSAQPGPGGAGDLAQGRGQPGGRAARRSMRLAVAQAPRGDDGGGRHGQYGPDLVRGGDQHWVVPFIWFRVSCCALNTSVVALSSIALGKAE